MSKDLNAPESIREGKRAQFAQESEGRSNKNTVKILALVALALVAAVAYVVAGAGGDRAAAVKGADGGLKVAGGEVSLPVSELSGKARFYEYKAASGKTVRFFAMKSSDGAYRAALDACDVCFAAKKGYRQEGDDMVCNNCGNHFHSAQVNEVHGGCNPVGLGRKVVGDRLSLSAEELEAGASYF
ncbi:MAG TPA: DUF2318 domain-containing protein [Pyrinomonadaceae bacterium]|jgi:uncharacterized membrane protein